MQMNKLTKTESVQLQAVSGVLLPGGSFYFSVNLKTRIKFREF